MGETAPPFLEIPIDEEDPRFSMSFDPNTTTDMPLAKAFFDEYGFCIFRNVISNAECQRQLDDMMAFLQEQFLDSHATLENPESLATCLSSFGCPKGVSGLFRPALLRLRQNELVHRALSTAMGMEDLIVNHDRWLLHRPPPSTSSQPLTKRNIHLDMNPWEYHADDALPAIRQRLSNLDYGGNNRAWIAENNDVHHSMGPCVQAIVNLYDISSRENGGTILVPGSHKTFDAWMDQQCADSRKRRVGPMQYTLDASNDSEQMLMTMAQHPTLRAGSMIVWDQRVFHGSTPNLSSTQIRAGVPLKAFPAWVLEEDPQRAQERGLAIQKELEKWGDDFVLTNLGRQVFGLRLIEQSRKNGRKGKKKRR